MTVQGLIEVLRSYDPEALVVMARDAEGNSYSPLSAHAVMSYDAETPCSGEVYLENLSDNDRALGYTEEDLAPDSAIKAVVLWPAN